MKNITRNMKISPQNVSIFVLILLVNVVFYRGGQGNYFFSDDFEWLGRAVLAHDSPLEVFRIEGRDFNPVFMILLTVTLRLFGLSPPVFRLISLLTFSAVIFFFFYLLSRYFNVNRVIALSAALLFGFNVFISEVVLNLSALVYALSLLLFLAALKFYLDGKGKRILYLVFIVLAFFAKETVILAIFPLFFYEKEEKNRWFIFASLSGVALLRFLLQLGTAGTGKYTDFLIFSNFFHKLYFTILRSLNISPYSMNRVAGIGILVLLVLVAVYFIISQKGKSIGRGVLFFSLLLVVFSLFFSLLPKLSSRYFFYPSFGFWGFAALLTHYFYERNKKMKYALAPLLIISMLFNYPLIKLEIEDYKILGDFSKQFIRQQEAIIKSEVNTVGETSEITIYKLNYQSLAGVYREIKTRGNLPKLLPFREHSVGGVIKPAHLVPIVFYPGKIVRWHPIKETPHYFTGHFGK